MKWKRAIGIGAVLYLATFVVVIVGGLLVGFDYQDPGKAPLSLSIVGFISAVGLAGGAAWWYFRKAPKSIKAGAYLGLLFVGVGTVVDALFIIPTILVAGSTGILGYYLHPAFWLTLLGVIGATSAVGYYGKA